MRLILWIIAFAKGRHVSFDEKVPVWYLFGVIVEKIFSLLRGVIKTRKLIFIGKMTSVKTPSKLFAAGGVEFGSFCQIDCLADKGLFIGRGSKIGSYCVLRVSGTLSDIGSSITIGQNVGIGDFSHIGGAGPVSIGNNTITGAYLSIHPENHEFGDTSMPIRLQGVTRKGISIGQDCWIGAKVTFLDGSSVGRGCVIAAGAVVTREFPDYVVIGGVPAKILKRRSGSE